MVPPCCHLYLVRKIIGWCRWRRLELNFETWPGPVIVTGFWPWFAIGFGIETGSQFWPGFAS